MSCLFHSLCRFVSHGDYKKLRQDICNFLDANQPLLDDLTIKEIAELDGITKEQYIQNMRDDNTWGGAPEIKAFCEMYKVIVKVVILSSHKVIDFTPRIADEPTQKIDRYVIISWNGSHFEPVLNKK